MTGSVSVVGLDGDDTLWHSEQLFVETQARFSELVAEHVDISPEALEERLLAVERRNVGSFGYGVKLGERARIWKAHCRAPRCTLGSDMGSSWVQPKGDSDQT